MIHTLFSAIQNPVSLIRKELQRSIQQVYIRHKLQQITRKGEEIKLQRTGVRQSEIRVNEGREFRQLRCVASGESLRNTNTKGRVLEPWPQACGTEDWKMS